MTKLQDNQDADAPIRAASYVRVSTAKQVEEGYSLDEQDRRVGQRIESEKAWHHVASFIEPGVSGRRDDRPQLKELLRRLDEFDVLVIPALSRLGRSARHLHEVFEQLDQAEVELVSLNESIDTRTATGRFVRSMFAAMAQFEADLTAERVAGSSLPARKEGKSPGGRFTTYGYERGDGPGVLIVVEAQAVIVVRIFRETLEGASQRTLCRRLEADRVPAPNGKRWSQKTIGRILSNEVYLGNVLHKGTVACEDAHPAIVSRVLFDKVAQLRAARDKAPGANRGRRPNGNHLFVRSMLRCGECGEPMSRRTYPNGKEVYRCTGRSRNGRGSCTMPAIHRPFVDVNFLAYFQRVGLDVEATRAAWRASLDHRLNEAETLQRQADRDAQHAADRLARVRRDYQDGLLDAADWKEHKADLTAEHDAATAEAERRAAHAEKLRHDAEGTDLEAEVYRQLADLRRTIIGEVNDAPTLDAIRAALLRLFEGFELHRIESEAVEHPGLYSDLLLPGGFVIVPTVREQAIEGYVADGAVPVLKRVPLERLDAGRVPLSQTA